MNNTLFRDVLFNISLILVVILTMIMVIMKVSDSKESAQAGEKSPGSISVHATWPTGPTDVDLWVFGAGEARPVGYSNQGGAIWNLLRDDLGTSTDATDANFETAYARGIVPGEVTVNLHCYRCPKLPVPVDVEIRETGMSGNTTSRVLFTSKVVLKREGEEKTVANFKINLHGNMDWSSLNRIYKPLRSAKKN